MEVCCEGKNCSKREQCRVYENNYWKYHDNSQWAQYEDWSRYGSCNIYQDAETGETIIEEEHWCGDFSKDYKLFKELTNKSTLLLEKRRDKNVYYELFSFYFMCNVCNLAWC